MKKQDILWLFYRCVRGNHRLYCCEKVGNLRLFYQCVRVRQKVHYISTITPIGTILLTQKTLFLNSFLLIDLKVLFPWWSTSLFHLIVRYRYGHCRKIVFVLVLLYIFNSARFAVSCRSAHIFAPHQYRYFYRVW